MISPEDPVYSVVINPTIRRAFQEFLKSQGKTLVQLVFSDDDTGQLAVFSIADKE